MFVVNISASVFDGFLRCFLAVIIEEGEQAKDNVSPEGRVESFFIEKHILNSKKCVCLFV